MCTTLAHNTTELTCRPEPCSAPPAPHCSANGFNEEPALLSHPVPAAFTQPHSNGKQVEPGCGKGEKLEVRGKQDLGWCQRAWNSGRL